MPWSHHVSRAQVRGKRRHVGSPRMSWRGLVSPPAPRQVSPTRHPVLQTTARASPRGAFHAGPQSERAGVGTQAWAPGSCCPARTFQETWRADRAGGGHPAAQHPRRRPRVPTRSLACAGRQQQLVPARSQMPERQSLPKCSRREVGTPPGINRTGCSRRRARRPDSPPASSPAGSPSATLRSRVWEAAVQREATQVHRTSYSQRGEGPREGARAGKLR